MLTRTCTKPTVVWVQGGSRHVESSAARTWLLARDGDSCFPMAVQRRWLCGAVMTHSVEAREKTAKARPTRARAKEARVEKVVKSAREAKARVIPKVRVTL